MMFLLMLTPKLRSARRLPRYSLLGLALGVSGFLLISIRNTAVLGPMASLVNSASYDATSLIDIGDIFTRVDFIVALNTTISLFFNICILYYAAAAGAAQFFKLKSMRWAILPVGAVSAGLALKLFNSSMEHLEFSVKYNELLYSPFQFLVPSVALLTATLRSSGNRSPAAGRTRDSRAPAPRPFRQRPAAGCAGAFSFFHPCGGGGGPPPHAGNKSHCEAS
jgi:spore germination protein KB